MSKALGVLVSVFVIAIILIGLWFSITPSGRTTWNRWFFTVQKADDATRYATIKKVEDTCRAMVSSYETDKLTYEQYKDSDNKEKQGWAEQAKMRANKTASTYNNYILQNNFVWKGNVPADIKSRLETIK